MWCEVEGGSSRVTTSQKGAIESAHLYFFQGKTFPEIVFWVKPQTTVSKYRKDCIDGSIFISWCSKPSQYKFYMRMFAHPFEALWTLFILTPTLLNEARVPTRTHQKLPPWKSSPLSGSMVFRGWTFFGFVFIN